MDNARSVSKTFSVTTNWTRVIVTSPADTTGAFDNDNNLSMELNWWMHTGSTYGGGTLQTTWASQVQANRAVGIDSIFDSTSRTFFITGVQLEVGDTATDFEHRTFGDELLQCQRYYQEMNIVNYPLQAYLAADHYSQIRFSPPLRAAATGTLVSTAIYFTGFDRTSGTTATGTGGYKDGLTLRVQGASGVNIGEAGLIVCTGKFDAEL